MIPRCSLLLSLFFALTVASVSAQAPRSLEDLSAVELVTMVVGGDSRSERIRASMVLVRKHGGTNEAMLAKGFLEFREGRKTDAIKLYRDILTQNPDYYPALLLLAHSLEAAESIEFYERAIEKDPSAHHFSAVRGAYSAYISKFNASPGSTEQDRQTIEGLLAKWEQKSPDAYVFDYLRALQAERARDLPKAEEYYKKAISKEPRYFEVYLRFVRLRLRNITEDTNEEELKHYLDPIFEFIKKNPSLPEPHIFLGELALAISTLDGKEYEFNSKMFPVKPTYESGVASLEKAFELRSTDENALLIHKTIMDLSKPFGHKKTTEYQQKAYEELLKISVKLPDSDPVFGTLAYHACNYIGDAQLCLSYYEKAISNSLLVNDRTSNVISLGHNVYGEMLFDHDKADELFQAELKKGGDKIDLLFALYLNRRNGQDFKAALKYLDELEADGSTQNSQIHATAIRDRRRQINTLINSADQTAAFYRDNQFLKHWQETNRSLVLTINYSAGSAVIPAADYPKLAQAAALLKAPDASTYIFAIEGHSDNTDADRQLSQQRAEQVVRHLHDRHGIEYKRMQPEGFGADFPIASNQTSEGRAKNRRVEILPLGRISEPRIAATAAMNADETIAVSPDGRFLAVGREPIQLWDTRDNTKVKDLGRGGSRVKFSPNGRYLATVLDHFEVGGFVTNVLVVYDVKTGLPVRQVPWSLYITNFDWDPLSQKIAYSVSPNQIVIYDLAKGRNVTQRRSPGAGMSGGDVLLWTRDGKYIVGARPDGRELQLYDAQSLALVKELPGVVWPHALAQTKDLMFLVCTSQSNESGVRQLTVWNTSDWSMRQMRIPALATDIAVHPEKHLVVLNDFGCGASADNKKCINASVLVDLDEMKVLDTAPVGRSEVQDGFSSNGNKLYQAYNDRVEVINVSEGKLKALTTIRGTSLKPDGGAADTLNKYFLSAGSNGIHIWSVVTGKKVHTWNRSVKRFGAFEDQTGYFWAIAEDKTREQSKILTFDTNTFAEKELVTLDFQVDQTVSTPEIIAVAGKKFLPDQVGAEKGIVEIYSRSPFVLQKRFELPLIMGRLSYKYAYDSGFSALAVNQKGTQVAFSTYWQDGFGHGLTISGAACLYNVATGANSGCYQIPEGVKELAYTKDNDKILEITGRSKTYIVDTQAAQQIAEGTRRANEELIKLKSGGEVFWAKNYIRYTPQSTEKMREFYFNGDLVSVAVFEDRNLLVTLNTANEISFYDLQRGLHELTILSKNDNEWIAYAPSGEFLASENGADKIFWSLGDSYLPFSNLRAKYESRDIIATKLDTIAKLNATASPSLTGVLSSFAPPYEVELISPGELQTTEKQYELILKVRTREANSPQPIISFSHQNQDLPPATPGTSITRDRAGVYMVKRIFDLADNSNYIQVYLHYGNSQNREAKITVTKVNKTGVKAPPSLWFLGLAVKSYQDQNNTLQFPIEDVKKIQAELEKQQGETKIYKKVNAKPLFDDQVNIANSDAEVWSMLKNAGPNDVFMIYISGHGRLNKGGNLVLMPAGSDLNDPAKGIELAVLLRDLRQKKPGQKVMIFLDICYAGSPNDPLNTSRITDVDISFATRETGGAAVFSSADGKSANEGRPPEYENGYFAKAILEALQGKSEPVLGQTRGKILTLELVQYVSERVFKETKGQQQPYPLRMDMVLNDPFAVCPVKSGGGTPD
jgi:outer membrane protein OmpA-like peptidoglycan-associated protein